MNDRKFKLIIIWQLALSCLFLLAWTYTYDTATPAGTDDPREADDRMREIKAANQEIMNVEHDWTLTGTVLTGDGRHTDVTADSLIVSGRVDFNDVNAVDITADTITLNSSGYIADVIAKGPWKDIRAYGAVSGGDSGTNATAIQAAIDAAGSGVAYVPPGNFDIDTQLTISATGATFRGEGHSSKISSTNLAGYLIKIGGAGQQKISVHSLRLAAGGSTYGGIWLEYANYCQIDQIFYEGSNTADAQIGILVDGKSGTNQAFWNILSRIVVWYTGAATNKTGIKIINNANATNLSISTIRNTNASGNFGINVDDGDAFTMIGGHIEGFQTGIRFNDHFGQLRGVRIEQSGTPTAGIHYDAGSSDTYIDGCLINVATNPEVDDTVIGGAYMGTSPDGVVMPAAATKYTRIRGKMYLSNIVTFTAADTTPTVKYANRFSTDTGGLTLTRFDDCVAGQEFTIVSKGATVFDTTANARLIGSSVDITTASGDLTFWLCETGGTTSSVCRLMGFIDVSADNSGGT